MPHSPTLDTYLEARRIAGETIRPLINQRITEKRLKESLVHLGIRRQDIASFNEAGHALVQDYLMFSRHKKKKSLVDRLSEEYPFDKGTPEATVLEAMTNSLLSLFQVEGVHPDSSIELYDVIGDRVGRLYDRNLSKTAYKGLWYATRVYDMPDFWMTSGAGTVLTEAQVHELFYITKEFGTDEDGRLTWRQPANYVKAFYRYLFESDAPATMGHASALR